MKPLDYANAAMAAIILAWIWFIVIVPNFLH